MLALRPSLPHQRGFTLVELMITVAIIGILSAVAYPSYTQYLQKGRRAEAKAALMENMQLFERHFAQVNTYAVNSSTLGQVWQGYKPYSGDTAPSASFTPNYAIVAGACPAYGTPDQCVELQARPNKGDPTCGTLVYRSTGEKANIITGTTAYVIPPTSGCW